MVGDSTVSQSVSFPCCPVLFTLGYFKYVLNVLERGSESEVGAAKQPCDGAISDQGARRRGHTCD